MRRHLTYANVISTVCLFILLGGSAYAATKLDGSAIKTRSIPGSKLKRQAVGSAEVRDGALRATDFRKGVIPTAIPGPQGPQGANGPQGPTGPKGERGPGPAPGEDWTAVRSASSNQNVCSTAVTGEFCSQSFPGEEARWSAFDAAASDFAPVAFAADSGGVVRLRGRAKEQLVVGSAYRTIFFLPAGYRPQKTLVFPVVTDSNTAGQVDVQPDGRVIMQAGITQDTGRTGWVSLAGITFRADG